MEHVKEHYNNQKYRTIKERKKTINIGIRFFNNKFKRDLLDCFLLPNSEVLDLGCGKGGDLLKYDTHSVKLFYGLDISNISLIEALNRARAANLRYTIRFKLMDVFGKVFDLERKFQYISCMFAFHYAFKTQETYQNAIDNICAHLPIRGRLVMTIPDSVEVFKRKESGNCENAFYKIENFHDRQPNSPFGRAYSFTLKTSVENCEEYIVDSDLLISDLKQRGIHVLENLNFQNYVNSRRNCQSDKSLYDNYNSLNSEEKDVVNLYKIMVFEKMN